MQSWDYIFELSHVIQNSYDDKFKNKSYGNDIESFAIISTCISKAWLANMGWKQ